MGPKFNVHVALSSKDFEKGAAGVTRSSGQAEAGLKRLESMARRAVAALGITVSAAGLLAFARNVVRESVAAQDALVRLQSIVTATGQKAGFSAKELSAFAGAIQETTRFADEAVMEAEATLLRFGRIQGETYRRALQAIVDVAAGTGKDLQTVSLGIGKSLEIPGEAMRALMELGIKLSDSQQKVLDDLVATGQGVAAQAKLLELLEGRYKGAAVAAADTLGGALDQLKNFAGELFEKIGEGGLAGGIQGLAQDLRDAARNPEVIQMFKDLGESAGELLVTGGRLAADVLPVLVGLIQLLAANVGLLNDALVVFLALKVWAWFQATALGVMAAGVATVDLTTAVWALRSGYAKLALADLITGFKGLAVSTAGVATAIGAILIALNHLIVKWGEAQDAATRYNLVAAQVEGRALSFAQTVRRGGEVSGTLFAQAQADAEALRTSITRVHKEVEALRKIPKEGGLFFAAGGEAKLREREQELQNLWSAYKALVPAIDAARVAVEDQPDPEDPFAPAAAGADKFAELLRELQQEQQRWASALAMLKQGMPQREIEALVEAAERLGTGNLFSPAVRQIAELIERTAALRSEFEMILLAQAKLADASGQWVQRMATMFAAAAGPDDPAMQALLANLREAKELADSVATEEERRLKAVGRAQALYNAGLISAETLQRVLLANADQWNIELSETEENFLRIQERLVAVADAIAGELAGALVEAWREGESVTDAFLDTMENAFYNTLQDILSAWLTEWFRAMAAWLARWIATQAAAKGASAGLGAAGGGGGAGQAAGAVGAAAGSGVSANTLYGWALAAFALYVVYKGFVERSRDKFAQVTIADGQWEVTASRGKKYLDGVQAAAEAILANLEKFLGDIDVTMTRLGTVVLTSSKRGWNVNIPGSTGKLFKTMEEAQSYAMVLALKYGEFADSVSVLVRAVITSTKAIRIEDLADDIAWARKLETQNLEAFAKGLRDAVTEAEADWRRAEDLFLAFSDTNLPAFAAAVESILSRLFTNIWTTYNSLAGIEEDPQKAWERKRAQYRVERAMIEAQLKLWKLEVEHRIANLKAGGAWLGGMGAITRGTVKFAYAMVAAAEAMDPALQELENILALINQTLADLPPLELPETDPGRKKGKGGGGRGQAREDLRETLADLRRSFGTAFEQELADVQKQYADLLAEAKRLKQNEAEVLALRARAIEELAQGLRDQVAQYLTPEEMIGGTAGLSSWQAQAAEIARNFTELRAANARLLAEEKKVALTEEQMRAAELRAVRALAEQVVDSLGLPMEQTRDRVAQMGEALAFLDQAFAQGALEAERYGQVLGELADQAESDLLGMAAALLDQMGMTEKAAEVRAALEEAQFRLQVVQINLLYQGYLAAGLIAEDAIGRWNDLLLIINDPANWPDFDGAGGGGAGAGSGAPLANAEWLARQLETGTIADILADLQREIAEQIEEWNSVRLGPLTREAREMSLRFADLTAKARALNLETAELSAAYSFAVRALIDDALRPFDALGLSALEQQLASIADEFADIEAAFRVVSATQADFARLEEARLRAIVAAWDQALQSVRDLRRDLRQGDLSILDGVQKFDELMAEFFQLQARFDSGDLSVLDDLGKLRDFLAAAREVIPIGSVAYDNLFAQVDAYLGRIEGAQPGSLGLSSSPVWATALNSGVVDLTAEVAAGNAEHYNELRLIRLATQSSAGSLDQIRTRLNTGGVLGGVN